MFTCGDEILCVKPPKGTASGILKVGGRYTVKQINNISWSERNGWIDATSQYWYPPDCFISLPDEIDRRGK